jgi:hypothetical protein
MRNPSYQRAESKEVRPLGAEEAAADVTRDTKAFTAAIRNRVFTFLRGLVNQDFDAALGLLQSIAGAAPLSSSGGEGRGEEAVTTAPVPLDAEGQPWTAARLQQALDAYHASHDHLCLDPNARNLRHTYITPSEDKRTLRVQQMLVDPEGHNDWVAEFEVDLAEARKAGEPVLRLRRIGSLA